MPDASITIIEYKQGMENECRAELQGAMADFQEPKQNGELKRFIIGMDTKQRRAIGIAFYKDEASLRKNEDEPGANPGKKMDKKREDRIKKVMKSKETFWFDAKET